MAPKYRSDANRVHIFDTTLRDGEQSPGISLNTAEKVEIAQQLARLGVDVIEAGFPITSPGDFEAVEAIAREVEGPTICGLARTHKADIDAAWGAIKDAAATRASTPSSPPPTSTSSTSCRPTARTSRVRPAPPSPWPGPTARTSSSRRWTRPAPTSSSPPRSARSRSRRAPPWSTSPTRSATPPRRSTRTTSAASTSWCRGCARSSLGPLPRRPGPGRRQLLRRRAGRRAPGRVRRQRDRRAGRQLLAGGDRDAGQASARTSTA